MAGSTVKLYWVPTDTYAIAGITNNGSHDVFQISGGDYTEDFRVSASYPFVVAGTGSNNGSKVTFSAATYTGSSTYVTATANVGVPEGAGGVITVPYHHIEWTWAKLNWVPSNPAKKVEDRNGIIHRINSPNSTALQRFFTKAQIAVFPEDLMKVASNGWTLRKMIYELCFLRDTAFTIFDYEVAVDTAAATYSSFIGGVGKLDNVENVWNSLAIIDGQRESPMLDFVLSTDGTFTDVDLPLTYSARTRP